jgi:hypothetical protein
MIFKLQMDMKIQNKKRHTRGSGYTAIIENRITNKRWIPALLQASCLSPFGPHLARLKIAPGDFVAGMTGNWDRSGDAPFISWQDFRSNSRFFF